MSLRNLVKRTQLRLEQMLHETRQAMRTEPASTAIEVMALEERILMSATPAAVMAVDPVLGTESAESVSSAATEESALRPPGGPNEDQLFEIAADSILPAADEDATTGAASEQSQELVFIDSSVSNIEQMISDLQSQSTLDDNRVLQIVVLDSQQNGIAQITSTLLQYDGIDGIHFVSHGSDGLVRLGATTLSLDNLDTYRAAIAAWQHSMTADADLLFYGCNLAATEDGQQLMSQIGAVCDCGVAASTDVTGHSSLGGDWDLEYRVGAIEADIGISMQTQQDWMVRLEAATPESDGTPELDSAELPLAFEENIGQFDEQVDFLARGSGYAVFLTDGDAVLRLTEGQNEYVVRLDLVGGNAEAAVAGAEGLATRSNYLLPDINLTDVANYRDVVYSDVYEGIDVRYYGKERQLEYDFIVNAGADTSEIRLSFDGAQSVRIDDNGDLVLTLSDSGDEIRFTSPYSYQDIGGSRNEIDSYYVMLDDGTIGFEVADYDHSQTLVIDPVLDYTTFLGGTGYDVANGIAVDSAGNAYITGAAASTDFPTTTGAYSETHAVDGSTNDIFVSKLSADGSSVIYSTFIGGDASDTGYGITVDSSGNAYVVGASQSSDFATVGAYQNTLAGTNDAVLLKLNAAGNTLIYSTYFGGSGTGDVARDIAIDSSGMIYVTGYTNSADFATLNAYDSTLGGTQDAFVAQFDLSQTGNASLLYSTYFGGGGSDWAIAMDLDASDNIYITGYTTSTDLTIVNGFQTSNGGGNDGFAAKFNSTGSTLQYSSYHGGIGTETGEAIAVDGTGMIYLGGRTGGGITTTVGAYDTSFGGGSADGYVAKVDPTLSGASSLLYSTYLGGTGFDYVIGLDVDSSGVAYLTGFTGSAAFPTTLDGADRVMTGANDGFFATVDAGGSSLGYSTFIGGTGQDRGLDLVWDNVGSAYVAGNAGAADWSGTSIGVGGGNDAFVSKYTFVSPPVVSLPGASLNYTENDVATVIDATATASDADSTDFDTGTLTIDFTANGTANDRLAIRNEGTGAGQIGVSGSNVTYAGTVIGTFAGGTDGATPLVITFNASSTPGAAQALMRNITYENVSDAPSTLSRTVRFVLTDGDGGTSNTVTETINVSAVNDAPEATDDSGEFSGLVTSLSPVSYWRLGEGTGPTATDDFGISDGTYNGGTLGQTGALAGDADAAVYFDGDDYIEIAHDAGYLIDNGTVQVWFNVDTPAGGDLQHLFSKDSTGTDTGGHLSMYLDASGKLTVRMQSTTTSYVVNSTAGISGSVWHHAAVSFGADGLRLYLDGALIDTDTYTGGLGTSSGGTGNFEPIAIGGGTQTSGNLVVTPVDQFFTGRIDEVSIFDSQLDAKTVQDLYAAALQYYTINEDATLNVGTTDGVLANDFDFEGDPVTAVLVTGPSNAASFTLNPDGSFDYTPNPDFSGTDTFTYKANDGADDSSVATVTINITATNDDPTNAGSFPGDIAVTEDVSSNVDLSAVDFSDVDAAAGSLTVTLTTSTGGDLTGAAGTGITLGGTPTALTVSGTLTDLNNYFNTASNITYLHGTPHTNGDNADTIQVNLNDNGNTGTGGGTDIDLGTVNVDISAVNDDPTNAGSLPSDISVTEDVSSNVELSAVDFSDVDAVAGSLTVTLTTSTGGDLTGAAGTGITLGGTPTALTVSGNLTDLNNYFNTASNITYLHGTPGTNGNDADTIQVEISDNGNTGSGGGTDINLGTVNVDIGEMNDAPVIGAPGSALAATEQVNLNIHGTGFTVGDADEAGSGATATLTVGEGTITVVEGDSGVTITGGNGTGTVTLSGSIALLDNLLTGGGTGTIIYLNSSNTPSASTTFTVTVNDGGNTGTDPGLTGGAGDEEGTNNVTINITATNDDPTNAGSLPSDISVTEDVSSNVDLSAVDFSDVDAAAGSLTVTLTTSTSGNLTAAAGTGITLGGTPTALTVSGTLTDLNTYFNTASNITYLHGTLHTNGNDADTIQVNLNDNGNTGTGGGTDIDLGTVNVDISAVNDDPTNAGSLPSDINVTEDVSSNVDLSPVDFSDVDAAAGSLTVTLTTSTGGDLTGAAAAGITLGGTPTALTVSGTLTDLNNYFNTASNITYLHGTAHTNGGNADTIQVEINDNGNTGTGGGTDINLGTVNVDITAVNDIPTLTSFAAVVETTNEDTEVEISFADLTAQGNEADVDGTVDAFVVKSIATGTLKIGNSAGTATAWAAGTNDTIDATNHAYWTPVGDVNGTQNAFAVVAEDNLEAESTSNITAQVSVTAVNDVPTLTTFAAVVETTNEDTEVEISFADLTAQGNEADVDGTVDAFVVKSIATGTLKIGTTGGTATAWAAGTNDTIDATNHAYWTPATSVNGTQNAFAVVAEDNQGAESASNITAQVSVTSGNDEETLTTNTGLTVNEGDANSIITRLMLETTDIDNTPNQLEYTVTSAPIFGTLRLSGSPLLGGATFYQSDINAGLLTYSHNGSEVFTDSFWLTVNDGAGTVSGGTFGITINPINDNDPMITSDGGGSSATLSVAENSTAVTTVTAADADLPAQTLSYSIFGGSDAGRFNIDSVSGVLTFAAAPDFEAPADVDVDNRYEVVVEVSDGQGRTDQQTIQVTVTDVDEFDVTPIVDNDAGPNQVSENNAPGTILGLTAFSNDLDTTNNTITYTLDDTAGGLFQIDSISGVVRTSAAIDFESTGGTLNIVVRATSADTSTTTRGFTVTVIDENDAPVLAPSGPLTIDENSPNGTVVGSVTASDEDVADSLTYRIVSGVPGQPFAIDSVSGQITVADAAQLAFETTTSFSITVEVEDAGGLTNTQAVTINLNDLNEAPVDLALIGGSVNENSSNGTLVGTVSGSDPDTGESLTYALTNDAGARFAVDANTGQVTVANGGQLNFESGTAHSITVRTTDASGLTYEEVFSVNVLDLNETPIALDETFQADQLQTLTVTSSILSNDSDVDGDTLTAVLVSSTTQGTLTLNADGTFEYTSTGPFFGTDRFTYVATDGSLQSGPVNVTIVVNPAAIPPPGDSDNTGDSNDSTDSEDGGDTNDSSETKDNGETGENSPSEDGTEATNDQGDGSAGSANPVTDNSHASNTTDSSERVMALQEPANQPSPPSANSELVTQIFLDQVPDGDWNSGLRGLHSAGNLSNPMLRSAMTSIFGGVVSVGPAFIDQFLDLRVASDQYDGTKAAAELKFNENLVVGSSVVVSTSLSVGYVVWMLRGGSLMTAFMSSIPAWQAFDPLPVIDNFSATRVDGDHDETLESLVTGPQDKMDQPGENGSGE